MQWRKRLRGGKRTCPSVSVVALNSIISSARSRQYNNGQNVPNCSMEYYTEAPKAFMISR